MPGMVQLREVPLEQQQPWKALPTEGKTDGSLGQSHALLDPLLNDCAIDVMDLTRTTLCCANGVSEKMMPVLSLAPNQGHLPPHKCDETALYQLPVQVDAEDSSESQDFPRDPLARE